MSQIIISKEILEQWYYDEKLTQAEIAERLGCSKSYISQCMRKHGLVARPRGGSRRLDIPREEIERLYAEGCTQAEIAEHFGCSKATIYHRMRDYGLLARAQTEQRKIPISPEELEAWYAEGLTQAEIAERVGCSVDTIYQRTREYGLVNLSPSNRRKLVIPREELEALLAEGLTQVEIAKRLGCSEQTIRRRRRQYGLETSDGAYQRIEIKREELERLCAEGVTLKQMAERFGCSQATVFKRMRDYGLRALPDNEPELFSHEQLYSLYVEQGLTTGQIADRLGCNKSTVLKHMKKIGIPRRIPGIQPKEWVPAEHLEAWPTPALAYVVGLITAHGCLRKGNRVINFACRNWELIRLYRTNLRLDPNVPTRIEEMGKASASKASKNRYIIEFTDRGLRAFLEKLGLTPAKSNQLGPLAIPDAVFADFVRGYCDGKGKWDIRWHKYLRVQLRSRSPAFLQWMQERIEQQTQLRGHISGNMLSYDGHHTREIAIALGRWLYYAPDVPAFSTPRAIWEPFA